MDEESAFATIVEGVLAHLKDVADRTDASLIEVPTDELPRGGPAVSYRLEPANADAAPLAVSPDDAYTTYLMIGRAGEVLVLTSPKDPEGGISGVIEMVDAVVAGRVRERLWKWRRTGQLANSLLYVQQPEGNWRVTGEVSRPLPLLRALLYEEEAIAYAPYTQRS